MALPIVLVTLALPTLGTSSARGSADVGDSLRLVSAPDDPFVGGRILDMTPEGIGYSGADALIVPFQRRDADGLAMFDDPMWVLRIETPSALVAGNVYQLDGTQSDILRLGDSHQWQSSVCPDLTGNVKVHSITTDLEGLATSVAASFVLHCTPSDTVYGSIGIASGAPPLPDGAQAVIEREARLPVIQSVFDGSNANIIAIDVRRTRLLLRWDTPSGFDCATASVTRKGESEPVISYSGRDDTLEVHNLDPTAPHTVNVDVGSGRASTCSPDLASQSSTVFPLRAHLIDLKKKPNRGLSVRGRVMVAFPGYAEPGRFLEIIIKGRRPDGSVAVLGASTTDSGGYFRLSANRRHAHRVWAVVEPGTEPAAPDSPFQVWYHFGDRSPGDHLANL